MPQKWQIKTLFWWCVMAVALGLYGCAAGGCNSTPQPRQGASTSQETAPEVYAEGAEQVTTSSSQESQQRQQESSVETGGETGDVSSTRYGLDEGMQRTLAGYTDVVAQVLMAVAGSLGRVIGSVVIATAGLLLLMIFLDAPKHPMAKTVGIYVGLAVMVGGPVAIWLAW